METFEKRLNDLLVDTFRNILKVEEKMIRDTAGSLSMSEIHLLDVVGECGDSICTAGTLATHLQVTMPSVTIAVGKLTKRGYLSKKKSEKDGRSVLITLTHEGEKIYRLHRHFHQKMVHAISAEMTESEKTVLLSGIEKLDLFFREKVSKVEN